jgi:hypothetical protein
MSVIIAEAANAALLHWWEIVTGVLAIPTSIAALVYTIVKIQTAESGVSTSLFPFFSELLTPY